MSCSSLHLFFYCVLREVHLSVLANTVFWLWEWEERRRASHHPESDEGGVTRINHINTNRASLPETPSVLYSLISNKSTSVCWDYCERKGTGEKCEKQMSKERARQSTEGITVCRKHWHSHASGPRSLPPSFFPTLHSSHGHTVLCVCVC